MMQQQMIQNQNGNNPQQPQQQMVLCPVRVVYETQILVPPGEQVQPNQTIFINPPQNQPPWLTQNTAIMPQNQMVYLQHTPNQMQPSVQQNIDQNQMYMQQGLSLQQLINNQNITQQHRQQEQKVLTPQIIQNQQQNVMDMNQYAQMVAMHNVGNVIPNIQQTQMQIGQNIVNFTQNQPQIDTRQQIVQQNSARNIIPNVMQIQQGIDQRSLQQNVVLPQNVVMTHQNVRPSVVVPQVARQSIQDTRQYQQNINQVYPQHTLVIAQNGGQPYVTNIQRPQINTMIQQNTNIKPQQQQLPVNINKIKTEPNVTPNKPPQPPKIAINSQMPHKQVDTRTMKQYQNQTRMPMSQAQQMQQKPVQQTQQMSQTQQIQQKPVQQTQTQQMSQTQQIQQKPVQQTQTQPMSQSQQIQQKPVLQTQTQPMSQTQQIQQKPVQQTQTLPMSHTQQIQQKPVQQTQTQQLRLPSMPNLMPMVTQQQPLMQMQNMIPMSSMNQIQRPVMTQTRTMQPQPQITNIQPIYKPEPPKENYKKRKSESPDEMRKITASCSTQVNFPKMSVVKSEPQSNVNEIGVNTSPVHKPKMPVNVFNNDVVMKTEDIKKEVNSMTEADKVKRNTIFAQARVRKVSNSTETELNNQLSREIAAETNKIEKKMYDEDLESKIEAKLIIVPPKIENSIEQKPVTNEIKQSPQKQSPIKIRHQENQPSPIKSETKITHLDTSGKELELACIKNDKKEPNQVKKKKIETAIESIGQELVYVKLDKIETKIEEKNILKQEKVKKEVEIKKETRMEERKDFMSFIEKGLGSRHKMSDKDNFVLTHVLDGIVIQESNVAFPIRLPLKERSIPNMPAKDKPQLKIDEKEEETSTDKLRKHDETENIVNGSDDAPFLQEKKENVKTWSVDELTSHLIKIGWQEAASVLQEHEIDGEALFLVNSSQLIDIGINEYHANILEQFVNS